MRMEFALSSPDACAWKVRPAGRFAWLEARLRRGGLGSDGGAALARLFHRHETGFGKNPADGGQPAFFLVGEQAFL